MCAPQQPACHINQNEKKAESDAPRLPCCIAVCDYCFFSPGLVSDFGACSGFCPAPVVGEPALVDAPALPEAPAAALPLSDLL
jgi:hypothetical protein